MRITLSFAAILLVAAFLTPSARAQASIPYRRTIDYIPNRPHEFTGRYVRINVSFSGGQPGPLGRSTTSMTLQSTINPGVGHGPGGSDTLTSGGGNDVGAPGAGRTMHRGPGLGTAGYGRTFRFGR